MRTFFTLFLSGFALLTLQQKAQAQTTTLWGMAGGGGAHNGGVIFQFDPATNTVSKKFDFDGSNNGANGTAPQSGLTLYNNVLYGATALGSVSNDGNVFKFNPATNVFDTLHTFNLNDGSLSTQGGVTIYNGKIYGAAATSIYEIDPATNNFSLKHSLVYNDGTTPFGELTVADNNILYGITTEGGIGAGTIISYDPATNTFAKVYDFNGTPDGAYPYGTLALLNGKLYGTADDGANNDGIIFEFDPATNTYTKKYDFDLTHGRPTVGGLAAFNNKLYGLGYGGAHSAGVIYEYDPATNVYVDLHDFNTTDGSMPNGILTAFNNKLYGATQGGGANSMGTLFSIDPATAGSHTKLYDFDSTNGSYPFVEKLVAVAVSEGINTLQAGNIVIYPNPAQQSVNVVLNTQIAATISFTDMLGRDVGKQPLSIGNNLIDIHTFILGIYQYRIVGTDGSTIQKGKITRQ